ncbi:GNAT family N-acetyltransferase [Granulosicoccus antarcticus]|uniref:BioF2-like acetyltransferase domain-containing protein n=1 Tax=Granulosicoccus antarcticus IMCC3135 TaxID=1192854 RepID=A0A2Z2NXT9_9GAMM|nr:GNAT family N-acetyltransferase [Granulosicoccus antarcticus]ASJ76083.1 hypothetical protein IMCC3135_30170 [Granulosicoccus antarcticus IMCC3135]
MIHEKTRPASSCRKPDAKSQEPVLVKCLDSAEAFDQLQAIWQELERQDTQCTPFNTWVWNSLWWQHYGTRRDRLTILIARQGNRVVGIAPLYIHATVMCKVIPVRVLSFIGTGGDTSPDYLNIITLPQLRNEVEQALLNYLPQIGGWHKLHLTDMLQASSLVRRVQKLIDSGPGTVLEPRIQFIQKAALPASFEDYRAQLSRKHRKQINHRQNRLDAAGVSELSICSTNEELAQASDALVSLHRLRWDSKGGVGGFRSTAYEQFHRAVIRHFFAMDALWLTTLKLDGSIIGVQYIFAWRGQLMFMQSGYSPEHERLSPGHVLFTYAIQRGIEQGMQGLDMLKGHYSYKSVYARDEIQTIGLGYLCPGVRRFLGAARDRVARLQTKKTTIVVPDGDANS